MNFIGPIYLEMHMNCRSFAWCQHMGGIIKRDMLPLNPILVVKIFDIWGIDFIGSFPNSFENKYILVSIDYVFEWVEAIPRRTADSKVEIIFFEENILFHFGTPRAIIND